MKTVLILGAGRVAKPMVEYLVRFPEIKVIVASRHVDHVKGWFPADSHHEIIQHDFSHNGEAEEIVKKGDVIVSLLPYTLHVKFAKDALRLGKHLVTTSYVSDEMKALDAQAREKGVLLLNEIGLDPGIDHMSAKKIIDEAHERGGQVVSFKSYCGGIPAPEANDNPLGYKFSWSPRGVLMAGRNSARYLENGQIVEIPGGDLFKHHWSIKVDGLQLETYTNRDSLGYRELYEIPEVKTLFRGTLRYPGWSDFMQGIADLGLLSEHPITNVQGKSYVEVFAKILNVTVPEIRPLIRERVRTDADEFIKKLEWLGLCDGNTTFPEPETTPIDFLTHIMLEKMQYKPGERDLVVLYHDFLIRYADHDEQVTSTLIEYGIPNGDSAMARTVSLPAAIAVRLILEGKITTTGVHIPVIKEIYEPVLEELENLGIRSQEKTVVLEKK